MIGTYLHGPVLAKSPRFADELLRRALRRRGLDDELEPLDDELADRAARVAVDAAALTRVPSATDGGRRWPRLGRAGPRPPSCG